MISKKVKPFALLEQRRIEKLVVVEGDAADGKSHYIRGEISKESSTEGTYCFTVSANEDFTAKTFVDKMNQNRFYSIWAFM
jgi:hypothetical protein